ncbi:MAG: hypothetical protein ACOZQL_06695 [Myxococcota bacterium]
MTTTLRTRSLSWLALAALVGLTGCPQVPPADPLPVAPTITSFSASAATVTAGDKVTLSWKVENATSVKIDDVKLGTVSGVSGNEGSVEVAINDESLFMLTARNDRGASDTAVVAVHVSAAAGQLLLSALPDTVNAGEAVTLVWSAPGASAVTLTAAPGGAIDLQGQGATGSVTVAPTTNTTYTLAAGGRSATASVTVRPTLLTFGASALSADAGSTVTLSWTTANASRVQLSAPGRGTLVDETDAAKVAAGSFDDTLPASVDPGQLFAYQLTVTGAGVTLTDSLVVTINGNPAVLTFTGPSRSRAPNAGALPDGGTGPTSIRLSWTTREAASVSVSANGAEFYRAPASQLASGSLDLPAPEVDTSFVLTARGARGGVATKTLDVDVVGKPTIALTAAPGSVAAGTPVTVSWTGTDLDTVALVERGFGGVYQGTGNTGMAELLPNGDVTYDAIATNGVGDSVTASANVTVTSPITLTVDQGTLRSGQQASVTWTAPGTPSIVGVAHEFVDVRAMSTGFDDISMTGTKLDLTQGGGNWGSINTPFRTLFFGRPVGDSILVSRYGYLTFSGALNPTNSSDEALPTAKLEPWTVAPYWDSLTLGSGIYWQVKDVSGQQVLIVQWVMSTATYEAKLYASGQIDFEYQTLPTTIGGRTGVVGGRPSQTVIGTPAAGTGLTFFGPRPSPLLVRVAEPGPVAGHLDIGGRLLRLSTTLDVVKPDELSVNEVLAASPLGVAGQWLEFRNGRERAVDLQSWTVSLGDGGTAALSGTVPARGLLVVGASTDPALNGDAGVQVAVTDFDLSGQANLVVSRGGPHQTVSVSGGDAGTAWVFDPGPFVGTATTRCAATASWAAGFFGTPGSDTGCGFPFALSSTTFGYYDISTSGTPLVRSDFDDEINVVDLTPAPFPWLGTARTSVQVSTNGFATFDTAAASSSNYMSITTPSTSDSNNMLSIFGDDLSDNLLFADAQIYAKRVAPNEDPYAAAPHWIIQWHHWSHYASLGTSADDLNFQIKLFDDGVVEYHFAKMRSQTSLAYGSGSSAVTWLENATGTAALRINVQATTPGLSPYSAFRFVPR